MKTIGFLIVLCVASLGFAQITVTGGDQALFKPASVGTLKPGSFGDEEFTLVVSAAKVGFGVTGYIIQSGSKRLISGSISKAGTLRANMKMGAGKSREVPVDGKYNPQNDSIVISSIGGKPVSHELPRFGKRLIKAGTYSARDNAKDTSWELTLSKSSGPDFNVVGFVEVNGKRRTVTGNLKGSTGKLLGLVPEVEAFKLDGNYDFKTHELNVELRLSGATSGISAKLEAGRLAVPQLFGLVEKISGKIPDEAEAADFKISGIQTEKSFQVDIIMKPPYEGRARVKNEYSSQLTSTLKQGDIIELTALSTSDKSGSYQPNLSISGFWLVEGDGAEVLEFTKTFAGSASDGKFYASSQGKTRFKVLGKGTIKITAVYTGHYWGPAAAWNWNPCTYVYKFKEAPKVKIEE